MRSAHHVFTTALRQPTLLTASNLPTLLAQHRLVTLLNQHLADGDLDLTPPASNRKGGNRESDGVAAATADAASAAATSADVLDPADETMAALSASLSAGTESKRDKPAPGRLRAKLVSTFSVIVSEADELMKGDCQQQPAFPPSCAVALLRGMARVQSVAHTEKETHSLWLQLALRLSQSLTQSTSSAQLSVQQVVTCMWALTKLGLTPTLIKQQPPPGQQQQQHAKNSRLPDEQQAIAPLWSCLLGELWRVVPDMNAMEVCELTLPQDSLCLCQSVGAALLIHTRQ